MQPTDLVSGRFSCLEEGRGDREEDERGSRKRTEAVLEQVIVMKGRILRLAITIGGIVAVALAGGAALKPF